MTRASSSSLGGPRQLVSVLSALSLSFSHNSALAQPCSLSPTWLLPVHRVGFFWLNLTQSIPLELCWWLRWYRTCLPCRRPRFNPWVGKIPWRSEWQPTPVFLPGESHGQRSLAGYSPWGRKKLDMTGQQTPSPSTLSYWLGKNRSTRKWKVKEKQQ